jgi:hypothetical protein
VPALEAALLLPLVLTRPHRTLDQSRIRRRLALSLTALVTAANAASLCLLVADLMQTGPSEVAGRALFTAALSLWVTNVAAFGLWFWELDRGGPAARCGQVPLGPPDFLFPQMTMERDVPPSWRPLFPDYLYVAFTNATAFSPTDTLPLSLSAKGLMLAESAVSVLIVILVAGRAVNILG